MPVHVLAVSDQIDERIYSETIRQRMPDVQKVRSWGDRPARYLEFLADALGKPVYFVLGNHAEELTRGGDWGKRHQPLGCIDLCGKVLRDPSTGLILAGLPGSPKYNEHEPEQYTEIEMTWMILRMAPRLLWNRWRHGRAVDILVTHAPPLHLNDQPEDPAHRGFLAIRRFLRWFRPVYHLHGHVHLYDRSRPARVDFEDTCVINVFPYRTLDLEVAAITDVAAVGAAASRDRESEPVQATSMEPQL